MDRERIYFDDASERAKAFVATVKNEGQLYSYRTGFIHGARAYSPTWISVESRLPQPGEDVLIYTYGLEGDQIIGRLTEDGIWVLELGESCDNPLPKGSFWSNFSPELFEVVNVTHWQPLPKAPNQ
jgi:hypothetical protein